VTSSIILQKFTKVRADVGPAQRKVIDYILEHPQEIVELPITELANRSGSSEATIVRLIQDLGYRGYGEFKIRLSQTLTPFKAAFSEDIHPGDAPDRIMRRIFDLSMETLRNTRQVTDKTAFAAAVEILAAAPRIEFYGAGGSGAVALDGYHKFIRLGIPVNAITDGHNAAQICAVLRPGDVVVVISHSGATRDAVEAAERARSSGAKLIAIARALVNDPEVILADEPTGNLPQAQWEPVLELLEKLNRQGKTVLIVSHEPEVARRAKRCLELRDGRVVAG
jgi:RpiR family carbohydrate utilization transcriptional regulator